MIYNWFPSSSEVFVDYGLRKSPILLNWPGTCWPHTQRCAYMSPDVVTIVTRYVALMSWATERLYFSHNACKTVLSNMVRSIYTHILNACIYWINNWCLHVPTTADVGNHAAVLLHLTLPTDGCTGSLQDHYRQCPRRSSQLSYLQLRFRFQGSQLAGGWKACTKNFFLMKSSFPNWWQGREMSFKDQTKQPT